MFEICTSSVGVSYAKSPKRVTAWETPHEFNRNSDITHNSNVFLDSNAVPNIVADFLDVFHSRP